MILLAASIAVIAATIGFIIGHSAGTNATLGAANMVARAITLSALTFIPAEQHKLAIERMRHAIRDL